MSFTLILFFGGNYLASKGNEELAREKQIYEVAYATFEKAQNARCDSYIQSEVQILKSSVDQIKVELEQIRPLLKELPHV